MIDALEFIIEAEDLSGKAVRLIDDSLDGTVSVRATDLKKTRDYLFAIKDLLNKVRRCEEVNNIEDICSTENQKEKKDD